VGTTDVMGPAGRHDCSWARSVQEIGPALLLALLSLPVVVATRLSPLDGSWVLGLSLAHHRGLRWGDDIAFTYGPLGFLVAPVPLSGELVVFGLTFWLLVFTMLVWGAARLVRPSVGRAAWIIAFLAASMCGIASEPFVALAAIILWSLLWVRGDTAVPSGVVLAILGASAGLLLLTKFNVGLVALAWLGVVVLAGPERQRGVGIGAVSAVMALVLAWLVSGQSLADLPSFLRDSSEIAIGYRHAMGTPAGPLAVLVVGSIAAWLGVTAVVLTWSLLRALPRASRVVLTTGTAMVVAAIGTTSFTRFDQEHALTFFLTVGPLAVILAAADRQAIRPERRVLVVAASYVMSAVGFYAVLAVTAPPLVPAEHTRLLVHPLTSLGSVVQAIATTVSQEERDQTLRSLSEGFLDDAQLAAALQQAVAGQRSHAEPWAVGALWASGAKWTPVPVFQSYSAYTQGLDEVNAVVSRSESGPRVVLRENVAIDLRHPLWESPRLQMQLVCSYEEAVAHPPWSVLVRSNDRCGSSSSRDQSVARGEIVHVPASRDLVAAEITSAAAARGRLQVRCDSRTYELAQRAPSGPLIMSVPSVVGWTPGTHPPSCSRLSFDRDVDIRWSLTTIVDEARSAATDNTTDLSHP
jgi:hypothetical protein